MSVPVTTKFNLTTSRAAKSNKPIGSAIPGEEWKLETFLVCAPIQLWPVQLVVQAESLASAFILVSVSVPHTLCPVARNCHSRPPVCSVGQCIYRTLVTEAIIAFISKKIKKLSSLLCYANKASLSQLSSHGIGATIWDLTRLANSLSCHCCGSLLSPTRQCCCLSSCGGSVCSVDN